METMLVELLKALADQTRLRIAVLLDRGGDLCSCEIETILGLEQSNASRHLRRLREAGVLNSYKKAQWVHYQVNRELFSSYPFLWEVLQTAAREVERTGRDVALLEDYRAQGYSCRTIHRWQPQVSAVYMQMEEINEPE